MRILSLKMENTSPSMYMLYIINNMEMIKNNNDKITDNDYFKKHFEMLDNLKILENENPNYINDTYSEEAYMKKESTSTFDIYVKSQIEIIKKEFPSFTYNEIITEITERWFKFVKENSNYKELIHNM
jgi:hypothetical protein